MNTLLWLAFDGRDFHGWQIQKELPSICGTLKSAIEKTLKVPNITINGCGRTDAGVHAEIYAANFRGEHKIPMPRLPHAINARLPRSISVLSAETVSDEFHAISSCKEKEYTYCLYTSPVRNPLLEGRAYHYPHKLDIPKMRQAAECFIGERDFACVRTLGSPVKSTVRNMLRFSIEASGEYISFIMRANGFLYNMARALVGTLLWSNAGKISDIPALIAKKDRALAGPVLPPHGLYMTGVKYE